VPRHTRRHAGRRPTGGAPLSASTVVAYVCRKD
jgi:hypothetical protein